MKVKGHQDTGRNILFLLGKIHLAGNHFHTGNAEGGHFVIG